MVFCFALVLRNLSGFPASLGSQPSEGHLFIVSCLFESCYSSLAIRVLLFESCYSSLAIRVLQVTSSYSGSHFESCWSSLVIRVNLSESILDLLGLNMTSTSDKTLFQSMTIQFNTVEWSQVSEL